MISNLPCSNYVEQIYTCIPLTIVFFNQAFDNFHAPLTNHEKLLIHHSLTGVPLEIGANALYDLTQKS